MSKPDECSMKPKMKRKTLWISHKQEGFLLELEGKTGIKRSEHMRRALDYYEELLDRKVGNSV
ncbi:hypothetical protein BK126_26530 [Paenibacillus sp. FSL H7-0326]|nr:hypothetical protein BK126_26530 [Paenibacillus sp. FSL H7-0326]